MKKILLIIISFLLVGCSIQKKFSLDNDYYKESKYINVTKTDIENLNDSNYLLFVYNNYCSLKIPCDTIFKKVMDKYNITVNQITFEEFKETSLYKKVEYAPTIIIVKKGKIIDYLDANSDKDLSKYQDEIEFENWLNKYINLTNE